MNRGKVMFYYKAVVLSLLLCFGLSSYAQTTTVKGVIKDRSTGAPMAFTTVAFIGTTDGGNSDFYGNYSISTTKAVDSITVSYIGYQTRTYAIKRGQANVINIELAPKARVKRTIVVKAGVDPAKRLIKMIQKEKEKQNKKNLQAYQYESFTKIQLAINNISEKYKKKKLIKQLGPMFDTISYLSEDKDKAVLPVFLSEVLSEFYFINKPDRSKEVIKASRVKGVGVQDGSFASQLLGSTFQQYNFHDNILPILGKNFVSPISTHSLRFYNYEIVQTDYTGGGLGINMIKVEPKNPLDLAFSGYIWIEDSTYALTKVSLSVPTSANLNYIEKLKITQEYKRMSNGVYIPYKNRILIDIAEMSKNSAGMIALFSNSLKDIVINEPKEDKFYSYPVLTEKGFTEKADSFWDNRRHEPLTKDEERVTKRIDSLTNLPMIKTWVEIVNIAVDGYYGLGNFDVGPYVFLYGYNALEGSRFRLGFRSNVKFSKKFIFKGYGAYGLRDEKWKYMGQGEVILSRKHWTTVGYKHRNDVDQIGVTDDDYGTSNLFTALSVGTANQLNRTIENKFWFASEFKRGWNARLTFHTKDFGFEPINTFNFKYLTNPQDTNSLASDFSNSLASVELRYAPKEYFLANDNNRVRVSGKGDLKVSLKYTKGLKGVFNGEFDYDKLRGKLNYGLNFGYMGRTDIEFHVTKVFGELPYPLLNVHRGNESFIYGTKVFNLMNFFEFASDESVQLFAEHHFNGAILNRIPLMKKLKWRLVLEGKGAYGSMTKANQSLVPNYDNEGIKVSDFQLLNKKPYGELGIGVENIFKIFRVDLVHRMTHWDAPNSNKLAVMGSLQLSF